MSELFVLCTEMSDTKFVTTKHSNAAVRLWGRNRKTTFRQNGKEKNDVHRDNEHRIVSPTIPIHSLTTQSGGTALRLHRHLTYFLRYRTSAKGQIFFYLS